MNNIDKTNSTEDLWLEYEQIRERLSLVLEKLRSILTLIDSNSHSPEIDFTSLISQIEKIIDAQSSLLTNAISSQTSTIQADILAQANNVIDELDGINSALTSQTQTLTNSLNSKIDEQTSALQTSISSQVGTIQTSITNQTNILQSDIANQTDELQDAIDEQTTTLQGSLSNQTTTLQNDIASQTQTLTQNLQSQITSQTTTIQNLLNSISQAISSNGTDIAQNSTQLTTLQQNISALQTSLTNMQTTLLNAIDALASSSEDVPFELDFDTIYATQSLCRVWRSYFSSTAMLTTLPEPFVANNQTPALVLATFDINIAQDDDVIFSLQINGQQIDTFTQHILAGTTSIQRQATFMTTQSNNNITLSVGSQEGNAKYIHNLTYKVVANNALFLKEMPQVIYDCWPVSTDVYITKRSPHFCAYKVVSLQNLDHSGEYTTICTTNDEDVYVYPIIVNYCPSTYSNFSQLAYGMMHSSTDSLELYNAENTLQKTINLIYSSTYTPNFINIRPYCDATYNTQILLSYPLEPRARRLRTYNGVRSFNSVQNFSHANVPIQMISNVVCTIKNGSSSGANDYTVYQDATGMWYINTFARLSSNREGFALGFGTRANLAMCPQPVQNAVADHAYFRAFICAYGKWYAYYVDFDKVNTIFTLQKTEIISGDFDQLLAGNANVYFGVKNGGFTTFYDSFYKSITEF